MSLFPDSPAVTAPVAVNPPKRRNLFQNYASFLGGTVFSKALGLVNVLLLTRYLGVEGFGLYSLVFSYWGLLNMLVDLGISNLLSRELARHPSHPRAALETALYIRGLGCLLFLLPAYFAGGWLGLSPILSALTVVGVAIGTEAFYETYFSATMRLDQNAKARTLSSLLLLVQIAIAVWQHWPLEIIILFSLSNPLIKLALDVYYGGCFSPRLHAPDWFAIRRTLCDSWPLWLGGLQYIVICRVDTLLLKALSPTGEHDLGIYSAAFRVSEVLSLMIITLCPSLMPLLVHRKQDPAAIQFLTSTGIRALLALLVVLSLGIFWYAPWIVTLYGPQYAESANCMRILIGSQALLAVNTLCYYLLLVYNAQVKRPVIASNTLLMALNIALNLWLIPHFKAEGAAWATIVTELATTGLMLWFLRRYTPIRLGRELAIIEALMFLACLPLLWLGAAYGVVSMLLFILLLLAFRRLNLSDLLILARERLPEAPPPSD